MDKYKLLYTVLDPSIDKLLRKMVNEPDAAIQNLLDTIEPLLTTENQKIRLGRVRRAMSRKGRGYPRLLSRMARDVSHRSIKTVGRLVVANLFSAAKGEVHGLEEAYGQGFPWIATLDWRESEDGDLELLNTLLNQGRDMGIQSYIVVTGFAKRWSPQLLELLGLYGDCLFLWLTPPRDITEEVADLLAARPNIITGIDAQYMNEFVYNASEILASRTLLYGGYSLYNEKYVNTFNLDAVCERAEQAGFSFWNFLKRDMCCCCTWYYMLEKIDIARMTGKHPIFLVDLASDLFRLSSSFTEDPVQLWIDRDGMARLEGPGGIRQARCLSDMSIEDFLLLPQQTPHFIPHKEPL